MKLANVSIARPVFATMMIATILVFGLNAIRGIGVDLMPNVEFPVVTVLTIYPGADPSAVEEKVSRRLEDSINTLPGIDKLLSYSNESVSQVVVQFKMDLDAEQCLQDVRDKVALVRRDLPLDIEDPLVQKLDMGAIPVLTFSVSGPPDMSRAALTRFADKVLRENLQRAQGVGNLSLVGGAPREIHLELDLEALSAKHLSPDDIMGALAAENVEIPGGRLERGSREVSVRVDNQVRSAREIGGIEILRINGAPVFVRDVARVRDTGKEERSYATVNGRQTIVIQLIKQSGSNVVATAHEVKKIVEDLRPTFPEGVKVDQVSDNSVFIEEAISDSTFDLMYGAVLAVLIIGFFLRNRAMTFISALAMPISIVGTFAAFQFLDFTFNYLTMLGLSLAVGIVIDDAIVVVENIYRHVEKGSPPMKAAREATAEIGLAVMATTFTIVAVFLPVAFMEGIVGRIFYQFGVTVAVAVIVSLFVSFTLTPMLSSRLVHRPEKPGRVSAAIGRALDALDRVYGRIVTGALRHRFLVILAALGLLGGSLAAVSAVPVEFIPEEDQERFQVLVETPPGSTLEHTRAVCATVEGIVSDLPGVELVSTTVGGGALEKVNEGLVFVKLVPATDRPLSQTKLIVLARERLAPVPGARISVSIFDEMMQGRAEPIQFALRGGDLPAMEAAAKRIADRLAKTQGFVNVDTSVREGKDEVRVRVDRAKASQAGVKPAQVAMAVRNLLTGAKVGEMAQGQDRYDIRVQLPAGRRTMARDLDTIQVRNFQGQQVSLADIASVDPARGPTQIERMGRQRQVVIYSNLDGLALADAQEEVQKAASGNLPAGTTTAFLGQVEFMEDSFKSMLAALVMAVILVYILLASQFESFLHPFTIMISLPFSVIGAFGALLASGYTLSIISMIGIIMLMGLVTKNAILLVDRANQNLKAGMERTEALAAAGRVRLRPILMTTFAMIFGMLPVALALSKGSEIRAPMAAAVIGGLVTSTLLTLVVIPVVYTLLDDAKRLAFRLLDIGAAREEQG
jgi:HAE1 family hydrophobic/amphiphilic exporter-1